MFGLNVGKLNNKKIKKKKGACLGWKICFPRIFTWLAFLWHIHVTSKVFSERPSLTLRERLSQRCSLQLLSILACCFIFHMAPLLYDIFLFGCSLCTVCRPLLNSALQGNKVFVLFATDSQHLELSPTHSKHSTNTCQVNKKTKRESVEARSCSSLRLTNCVRGNNPFCVVQCWGWQGTTQ